MVDMPKMSAARNLTGLTNSRQLLLRHSDNIFDTVDIVHCKLLINIKAIHDCRHIIKQPRCIEILANLRTDISQMCNESFVALYQTVGECW